MTNDDIDCHVDGVGSGSGKVVGGGGGQGGGTSKGVTWMMTMMVVATAAVAVIVATCLRYVPSLPRFHHHRGPCFFRYSYCSLARLFPVSLADCRRTAVGPPQHPTNWNWVLRTAGRISTHDCKL